MWNIFSVCERSRFFKARLLEKYFYNRITPEHNFGIIGKLIKNSVTWCAYLKMSKLGDIPHYVGAGHIFVIALYMYLIALYMVALYMLSL